MFLTKMSVNFNSKSVISNPRGKPATGILRPIFNWGNNILCSGTIINIDNLEIYEFGKWYEVHVDFFLVDRDAYYELYKFDKFVKCGMELSIQAGNSTIGKAVLLKIIKIPAEL